MSQPLPPTLAELVEDFAGVQAPQRLQLLLELSDELPELPERYAGHTELLERVDECASPLFLAVEVDPQQRVRLFFEAPPEAPTTRGFAGLLHRGLDGEPAEQVLAVPDDFYMRLGLATAVSPLRLRGLAAMLARIKRNVRAQLVSGGEATG